MGIPRCLAHSSSAGVTRTARIGRSDRGGRTGRSAGTCRPVLVGRSVGRLIKRIWSHGVETAAAPARV